MNEDAIALELNTALGPSGPTVWQLHAAGAPRGIQFVCAELLRLPEHSFYRATADTAFGHRAFVIFACDCNGPRQYEAQCHLLTEGSVIERSDEAYNELPAILLWLGNRFCPPEARWQRIPLPPGAKP